MILAQAGVSYEDHRLPREDWPAIKPSTEKYIGYMYSTLGVKIRNLKVDFKTGGTWRRVGQYTLIMNIYDFFYSTYSFSLKTPAYK